MKRFPPLRDLQVRDSAASKRAMTPDQMLAIAKAWDRRINRPPGR